MRILLLILFPFILSAQNADYLFLQGRIDSAIKYNAELDLRGLKRFYTIDRPLIAADFKNGEYRQIYFRMVGSGSMWDNGNSTTIMATFNDAPVFSIQKGKGVIIQGITFLGPGIGRDSRYSPQAAICIDPFSGTLPPDSGYPTLREWYRGSQSRGGSTGCRFEDCTTGNTTVGIIVSPNGFTQNGEILTFENIRLGKHKYGIAGCQAQEKMNRVINVGAWSDMECLFQFNTYGAQQPGNWVVDGVNVAGTVKKLISRYSGGWGPMYISNVFAENIITIGEWYTNSGDVLNNAFINFKYKDQTGYFPEYQLKAPGLTITNSNIRYYGETKQPVMLTGVKDGGGNSLYVQPVTDTYGWETGKKFRITQPFLRSTDSVKDCKVVVKYAYPNTIDSVQVGDFVLFMNIQDQSYQGQGQVTAKDSVSATVKFISPSIKTLSNYRVGVYKKL